MHHYAQGSQRCPSCKSFVSLLAYLSALAAPPPFDADTMLLKPANESCTNAPPPRFFGEFEDALHGFVVSPGFTAPLSITATGGAECQGRVPV